jgi:hypothetical protein
MGKTSSSTDHQALAVMGPSGTLDSFIDLILTFLQWRSRGFIRRA